MRNIRLFAFAVAILLMGGMVSAQSPVSADVVMKEACSRAAKEKKNVFLMFRASWCGWCRKMDNQMNDPAIKAYFDKSFVKTYLTVMENGDKKKLESPGAEDMLKKYHGYRQGIPFWLIFDAKGKLLADCLMRPEGAGLDTPGNNTGCPSGEKEVAHFIQALRKSTRLNEKQLAEIAIRFKKKDPSYKSK